MNNQLILHKFNTATHAVVVFRHRHPLGFMIILGFALLVLVIGLSMAFTAKSINKAYENGLAVAQGSMNNNSSFVDTMSNDELIEFAELDVTPTIQEGELHLGIEFYETHFEWLSNEEIFHYDKKQSELSNIGLAINPGYAAKHKIDPMVVKIKDVIIKNYLTKYAPVAVEEMKVKGIPASITLAQGLLESNVGYSRLAVNANNHFGIKCFSKSCGKGHCINATDDTHKDFFIKYETVWKSYRAHSEFLHKTRYERLFKLSKKDYKAWAIGLKQCGYATDKKYAEKLIKLIEELKLYKYDS